MLGDLGSVLCLRDALQHHVGTIYVEAREGDLLLGQFVPGPAFAGIARLFRDLEEAAESQALGLVDDLDAGIAALGLCILATDASAPIPVRDVQIWSDGGVSCRLCPAEVRPANGTPRTTRRTSTSNHS